MDKFTEDHLKGITVNGMDEFKSDAFILYASANGVRLGLSAFGRYVVKLNDDVYAYDTPKFAISKYKELVFKEHVNNSKP